MMQENFVMSKRLSKPFDKDLERRATEKTKELVAILNKHLTKLAASLGPGKNSDIVISCKSNPSIKVDVEVEIVREDRWKNIVSGKYPTVRWPYAKVQKCEKYSKEGKILLMLSANEGNLSEILYIDCETWVRMGHLEKARAVRTENNKKYIYRKGGEEPFWGIEKDKVNWGIAKLEEVIINLLKEKKGVQC